MSVIRIEWTLGENSGSQYFSTNDEATAFCKKLEKQKYEMAGTLPSEVWMKDMSSEGKNVKGEKLRPKTSIKTVTRLKELKLTVSITHPKDGNYK